MPRLLLKQTGMERCHRQAMHECQIFFEPVEAKRLRTLRRFGKSWFHTLIVMDSKLKPGQQRFVGVNTFKKGKTTS